MTFENPNPEKEFDLGFKIGDRVAVKRTSGDIENDWTCSDIESNGRDITIFVQKMGPDGHRMIKGFSKNRDPEQFQELLDLNKKP
ncbi:MAG: hypothetical protein A2655_02385 [Candidatus Yanofskybacteria bacterium RIFCSPHIGHO2_01_FULL_43_42]|uniref:Uncharacterized protein n=1 Tax=Candidatus Yanofskybacteria bacterium RIFCSPLOWO2_01_FULL_43_22 TaxID=1802695 RepID=A0A1F8GI74_9BACT|nr:MAG: hypothetical protein A2655_02385 [Candidatus Yanofskybacteria bacterium RIFCSPHIGHO2_01_FULL_43_42]OGN13350.1 MAG: hypothetical protein A3D48_00665 [Candidatus Yanofskybacteria bacterium RIFCSPHIGHO2_02_FULL_43_17]OGN24396.1 MAG: hypothetical protein A3A13_01620 [Candidatus Yanofskybacteria bacterium RIFCSPLOWO2_01_FULL_43_22]